MGIRIREFHPGDLDAVHSLNEAVVPHVNSISTHKVLWFAANADYFRLIEGDGTVGGMLIGFRPGSSYDSPFYQWFCRNFDDFAYIDRVAISGAARRQGLARALYEDFELHFRDRVPRLTCEVNLIPVNESSMAFHRRMGFSVVEVAEIEAGVREVARLTKPLQTGAPA